MQDCGPQGPGPLDLDSVTEGFCLIQNLLSVHFLKLFISANHLDLGGTVLDFAPLSHGVGHLNVNGQVGLHFYVV